MSRQPKVFDDSRTFSDSFGRIRQRETGGAAWWSGDVVTFYGIVSVYIDDRITRYDFAHRGRLHIRTERRQRTVRGAAIQATKFARQIARSRSSGHPVRDGADNG